ncbi:uncharacterized protein N0V89_006429 [Didymosphaeria variabile]|uniref:RPA43 OB domain-containing protein n=1 Tax=Didymosphaeria variabile TaxID=1932322 RepID=A0A9W8XQC8_9PLEO|nr:uncharacterized protein N0V89_006429 [Didymosphaeria variabile]KAJ4354692.1 hypothetical protein N0V89_006429 [Didymosphaeria variabile]
MAPIEEPDTNLLHVTRISQYRRSLLPLLLSYYPPAKGVVLAYEDVSLSSQPPKTASSSANKSSRRHAGDADADADDLERIAEQEEGVVLTRCVDEYMAPYVWATASLLIWRPAPNSYLDATLTHQSATHITLAHLNTFAITVLKESLPADWTWHTEKANKKKKGFDGLVADEGGWWMDGELNEIRKGLPMRVRVREWDVRGGKGKGVLRVDGSLLSVEEERSKVAKKAGKAVVGRNARVTGGEVMEVD